MNEFKVCSILLNIDSLEHYQAHYDSIRTEWNENQKQKSTPSIESTSVSNQTTTEPIQSIKFCYMTFLLFIPTRINQMIQPEVDIEVIEDHLCDHYLKTSKRRLLAIYKHVKIYYDPMNMKTQQESIQRYSRFVVERQKYQNSKYE